MKKAKKISPVSVAQLFGHVRSMVLHHHHEWGLVSLAAALIVLSLFCAIQPGRSSKLSAYR